MELVTEQMRLLNRLLEMPLPDRVRRYVVKAQNSIGATPITKIIDAIPGDNLTDKARFLGISRQAIHQWLYDGVRPSISIAQRIAKVTKFEVEEITGKNGDGD